ncbi:hypothetical protein D3C72_1811350 [compost metagenome]
MKIKKKFLLVSLLTIILTISSVSTAFASCIAYNNYWYSGGGYGKVYTMSIAGSSLRRTNMTVNVENFSSSSCIRIQVKKGNTIVFDTINYSFSYLNTSGTNEIEINLPASGSYTVVCDMISFNEELSSGRINVWTY